MTNYFDFYGMTPAFLIDEGGLKRTFYQKSKAYHPDFYTLESEEKQEEILRLSTLNNEAYKVLSDFHRRMFHILDLHGMIEEEGKAQLPQTFLIEMMDVNEAIMELQFDPDPDQKEKVRKQIADFRDQSKIAVTAQLESFDAAEPDPALLVQVRDYHYKHKYLRRLEDNLEKI